MISMNIGGCAVDILPFVSGLRSEAEKCAKRSGNTKPTESRWG